jgi:AcrR family transcriptional regulator
MMTKQPAQQRDGHGPSFTARQRASLIVAGKEVPATIGPDATVEHLAEHAEVSPTTIYNHVGSKEAMFSQALAQIWREWLEWAHDGIPVDERFDVMIDVCRKLFRAKQTHPLFSQILSRTLDNPQFVIDAVTADSLPALEAVALLGRLNKAEFEKRTRLFSYCLSGILHGVYSTQEMTAKDTDASLEIALALWGLSPDAARAITARPLGD